MKLAVTSVLLSLALLGGCTRAIVATYEPGIDLKNNGIQGTKLAIYQFEDERAWIDSNDEKSKGFIAKQESWRFGLKYENVEFQPVTLVLQDVLIKEFKSVGVEAYKGEESSGPSYSMKGKILNFEFENEQGMFTVTSRRHVSLALTLADQKGKQILANELFNEVSRENEGGGVLHSTNVDKLMKDALKKVIVNVVNRTNSELSSFGVNAVNVSLNGVDITKAVNSISVAELSTNF